MVSVMKNSRALIIACCQMVDFFTCIYIPNEARQVAVNVETL